MSSGESSALPVAGSNFNQQGSVDWVNLVTQSVSFSVGLLARVSAAKVDPYTVVVGQAISQNFHLAPVGHKNLQQALKRLRSYGSVGDVLWFGFGVRSFVRTLGMTDEGRTLLAICAVLGECFHEDLAAEVLHDMALHYKAPESLTPSTLEWSALVKACAGVFVATDFPVLAERLMSLEPSVRRLTTFNNDVPGFPIGRGCPSTDDLAAALIGLAKVSRKELSSISIQGGAAGGWLAAVAVWLFDISVTISHGQQLLYTNSTKPVEAQIQIMFDSYPHMETTALKLVSSTYYLKDSSEFIHEEAEDAVLTTISGRLPWKICLSTAFGGDFLELMKTPQVVGTAFGCAARIFKAITRVEPSFDREVIRGCRSYFDAASGLGFVENTIKWFPELETAKPHMESGAKMTLPNAKENYEQNIAMMGQRCRCKRCKDEDAFSGSERFCLVVLFETIVAISQALAGMTVGEDIHPARAGFELFYTRQLAIRLDGDRKTFGNKMDIGPIFYVLETTPGVYDHKENIAENRILDASRLFTGRDSRLQDLPFEISALSTSGLCFYLDVLRELSLDRECAGRVHVIPGRIEREEKPFYLVVDRSHLNKYLSGPKDGIAEFTDVSLSVKETVRSLTISCRLSDKKDKAVQIGPAALVHEACSARGLVNCNGRKCGEIVSIKSDAGPFEEYSVSGKQVFVCKGDQWFRCASLFLGMTSESLGGAHCILRTDECIQCCFRAAVELDFHQPVFIIS
jgi:hypothetical protein